jgi:hypothetical protein
MLRLLIAACALIVLRAEIVDRIVITVGRQVITQLQLDEELRVTAFLNGQAIDRSIEARRAAAGRLIQQLLIRREMQLSRYPMPAAADADNPVEQIRATWAGSQSFDETLRKYNLDIATLRDHLATQATTLQFIEFRFRPDLGISPADIELYYQNELGRWKTEHPGVKPPTLGESQESIRKTLTEQRTDAALDTWLEESHKQVAIVYLDKSLE